MFILLVLSRKEAQEIMIGEHIAVSIIKIRNGKIKIGIDAPREVNIRRVELNDSPDEKIIDLE